jgi:O-antigen/teichoic acid export membrane protein
MVRQHLKLLFRKDAPIQITLANLTAFALTFFTAPMIARAIGPSGRGETAAALAAFVITPVLLAVGLPLEFRRRCASGIDAPSVRSGRDLVLFSFLPALCVAFVFTSTIFSSASASLRVVAFVGLASAPLTMSWALDAGALVGSGRYRAVALLRIVQPLVVFCSIPFLWWANVLIPEVVLLVYLAGTLLTSISGLVLVRVGISGKRANHATLLHGGIAYAGSAIAEAASARIDQVLVLPLIGAAETGYYSVASSIATLPMALGQALGADYFREMSRSTQSNERRRVVSRSFGEIVSIGVPACLTLGLASIWLLPLLFGSEFESSVRLLMWLLPGAAASAAAYVGSMLLAALGRGRTMAVSQLASLAVGVILLYVLAPAWLGVGAALASAASSIVLLTIQLLSLRAPIWVLLPRWRRLQGAVRSLMG